MRKAHLGLKLRFEHRELRVQQTERFVALQRVERRRL
jgi:hypothetical protein